MITLLRLLLGGCVSCSAAPTGAQDDELRVLPFVERDGELQLKMPEPPEQPGSPWTPGLSGAGQRTHHSPSVGPASLHYVLARATRLSPPDLGKLGFMERWLLDEVRRLHPELGGVAIEDRASVRHDGERSDRRVERLLSLEGPPAATRAAEQSLDALCERNGALIHIELALREQAAVRAPSEVAVQIVDGAPAANVLGALRDRGAPDVDSQLSVWGGQEGVFMVTNQVAYIADFELERVGDTVIADPRIDVVQEGFRIQLFPILDLDGRLHLKVEIERSELRRPIEEQELTLFDGGAPMTIQVPEVDHTRIETETLVFAPGEAIVIESPAYLVHPGDDGDPEQRCFTLCLRAQLEPPTAPGAEVLGYDADTRRVFVSGLELARPGGLHPIVRDGQEVGRAELVEKGSPYAILILRSGTARSGDRIGQ